MNVTTDLRGQRMAFEKAKVALSMALLPDNYSAANDVGQVQYNSAMSIINAAVLSQSYLRFEQTLTATTNTFTFQVLDQGGKSPTEIRLTQQDAFYCYAIRVSLASQLTADPTAMVLQSYPNPQVFTTSGAAASMETFYNGYYSLQVNKQTLIPNFPLMNFRNVPQTQQIATSAATVNQTQWSGQQYQAMQPNPVYIGQKGNLFTITLPTAIKTIDATTGTVPKIVVEIFGVLAQNVTVVS